MDNGYLNIAELLQRIEQPNTLVMSVVYDEVLSLFSDAKGSSHNHQAWTGGYIDHMTEIGNISIRLYGVLNALRPLPFSRSDPLLCLLLHDIEKPPKYSKNPVPEESLFYDDQVSPDDSKLYRERFIKRAGIVLTPAHETALEYCHGELHDFSPTERKSGPLASFVHSVDALSARLWHDQPNNDLADWGSRYFKE
jgi:hypothetical protein